MQRLAALARQGGGGWANSDGGACTMAAAIELADRRMFRWGIGLLPSPCAPSLLQGGGGSGGGGGRLRQHRWMSTAVAPADPKLIRNMCIIGQRISLTHSCVEYVCAARPWCRLRLPLKSPPSLGPHSVCLAGCSACRPRKNDAHGPPAGLLREHAQVWWVVGAEIVVACVARGVQHPLPIPTPPPLHADSLLRTSPPHTHLHL